MAVNERHFTGFHRLMNRNKRTVTQEKKEGPRDIRIQFLVSGKEAEAVDTWGAENGLASKAEMIRQLYQIGLEASAKADALEEQKLHLLNVKRRAAREIVGIRTRLKSAETQDERVRLLERGLNALTDAVTELVLATTDITTTATRIFGPAVVRRMSPDVEAALYSAEWGLNEEPEPTDDELRQRLQALSQLQGKTPPKPR